MKSWYCIQTRSKQERAVKVHLTGLKYDCYLPLTLVDKRIRRYPKLRLKSKREFVTQPLFPTYCFVHMEVGRDDFHAIKRTPGVIRMVTFSGDPVKVPDALISDLMALEDKHGIHSQHKAEFSPGDQVRVADGPFKDIQTQIESIHFKGAEERAVILIQILGKANRVAVDLADLEPAA